MDSTKGKTGSIPGLRFFVLAGVFITLVALLVYYICSANQNVENIRAMESFACILLALGSSMLFTAAGTHRWFRSQSKKTLLTIGFILTFLFSCIVFVTALFISENAFLSVVELMAVSFAVSILFQGVSREFDDALSEENQGGTPAQKADSVK